MKQLNPYMKFRTQNTQKVKHRTFTIDYTKTTFFWENDLQSPDFVSDIIDSGYRLLFKDSVATKCFLRNNRSALNNPEFVESAILQLLKDGRVEEQSSASFWVNQLSVAEGKKKRLVLDLRHVNKFLHKPKFRHKNLDSLSQVFEKGDSFFNWDLKSGYHHVNIYQPHKK